MHAGERGSPRTPVSHTPEPVSILGGLGWRPSHDGSSPAPGAFLVLSVGRILRREKSCEKAFRLLVSSSASIDDETHPRPPSRP